MADLLSQIDTSEYPKLGPADLIYYLGEYTAGGGFQASKTNQEIINLKKPPTAKASEQYWKQRAIDYWGDELRVRLGLDNAVARVTLVPAPCSKLPDDPEYDDRMLRVLQRLATHHPGLDVRPLLIAAQARPSQHAGDRLTVAELQTSMRVDTAHLMVPLRRIVILVDDVFTQGGTMTAMKNLVKDLPGVRTVCGVVLAKTVWPRPAIADVFGPVDEVEWP
jgi:hypothetical protein